MNKFEDEESGFSLGGLPEDFGNPIPTASDSKNFPNIPGYRVTALLGQGGMGAVYSATKLDELSSTVAIKTIFLPRFQTIADANRKRFDRERELLGKLKHPNIVPILDQGSYEREYQNVPYFTMPLLEKGDMADALERAPIRTQDDLLLWVDRISGVLDGLAVAHRCGIVHRDIKPRNLFVNADGSLLLGDFGLAKILQEDSELTSTIGRMGTTPYASPEQLLSAKLADSRADIYALGVILYQFACFGIRPFAPDEGSENSSSETDSIARWQRSTDRTAPRPSLRPKHLSDSSFDFIVQKCLAYYPEHRYPSVEALLIDLRSWRRGELVRGNWKERFRHGVMVPLKAHLLLLTVGASLLIGAGTIAAWYKFTALAKNVSSLEEDVGNERQKQQDVVQKRQAELRDELQTLLPRLEGEERDFEVRRLPDPQSEFRRLRARARAISEELRLAKSPKFADRHCHWAVERTSVPPSLKDGVYAKHVQQLIEYTQSNLQLAQSSGDVAAKVTAVSDLMRSHRMLLMLAWRIAEKNLQDDYRPILDADKVLLESGDTLRSLRKLEVVQNVPALQRTVELMLLEIDLMAFASNPAKVFEICRQHQSEFSAERLSKDGCKHLFPWYLAWYIFEIDFETSKKLGRSASELQPIVDGWHDLMLATPTPGKKEETNIVYLKDLIVVEDRLGDVLRELGQFAKAKQVYEANWLRSESLRAFYKFDEKVWYVSEQAISSLLVLAEKEGNRKDQLLNYSREQKLLREKLAYAQSNPEAFEVEDVTAAKFDLAKSQYRHARMLEASERQPLLAEAESLSQEVLKLSPKDPDANALHDAIKVLMTQE
jgi:serine/threonine protein kinase